METIKELAQAAQSNISENERVATSQVSTNVKHKKISEAGIFRLFNYFQRCYGSAWASNLKHDGVDETNETIELWTKQMKHLTPAQISFGSNNLGKYFLTFPPTVFEFVDLCEQMGKSEHLTAAHKLWQAEPVKVAEKAVGEASLAKMKEDLGA